MGIFTEHWYCPSPIKASERMPPPDKPVLLFEPEGGWQSGYWDESLQEFSPTESCLGSAPVYGVTHWIELPPHPDAGSY